MPKNVTAETDAASIEASFVEVHEPTPAADPPPVEPRPIPGPAPLTRSDVLRCARSIQAQVVGLSGCLEQAALTPGRIRPEFLNAWHAWVGDYLANVSRLERELWQSQVEAAKLAGYAKRRDEWRGGIAAELGATSAGVGAQEAPKQVIAPRKFPWFVWIPTGFGCVVGAYLATRWLFRQCVDSMHSEGDREQSGENTK
jgi:hypothetical protein